MNAQQKPKQLATNVVVAILIMLMSAPAFAGRREAIPATTSRKSQSAQPREAKELIATDTKGATTVGVTRALMRKITRDWHPASTQSKRASFKP